MKLVAAKDFANVKALGLTVDPKSDGFLHEGHVQKGYRFNIGNTEIYDDLTENEKGIITRLVYQSKVAVIDRKGNEAVIAKIDREVRAAAAVAKASEPALSLEERIAAAVALALKPAKAGA